ncbi:ATP-binding protein [Nocardia wallacei]|uniref:AAA+ ATPase domain-containing protein n=1 Tax=Nocardia wallacei TaxID=480035 RepID=A0A7G1KWW8_9NOCA|nr:AAA family ATPase [Nocardia wallacei]BCK59106.1 hypothetical protein NWFMUON74_68780 [Nocardia wallacei]
MALIGRDHVASLLRDALSRTVSSHGSMVVVTGEAGIGKTTFVTEVVGEFAGRLLVFAATAWSGEGTPGFWPWVQVLRGLRRAATADQWAVIDNAVGNALSTVIGEAPEAAPESHGSTLFRVGDAVTEALITASAIRPVVVVIDDLHRADPESVAVLAFVARHTWFERITIVCTARDTEIAVPDHPLHEVFAELTGTARVIELTGLSAADTATVITGTAGRRPPEEALAALHGLTGGNPFLADQAARLWRAGTPLDALAPGVADLLDTRLTALPESAVDALATAALLGREFDISVLESAAGCPVEAALAAAVRARLVVPLGTGRHGFAHDLIRERLAARLDPAEARKRHADIVSALADRPAALTGSAAAELAHHALLAGEAIDSAATLRYLLDAARAACGRMAAGEVVQHYRHALALIGDDQPELRGRTALNLATAATGAGDLNTARRTYESLLELARKSSAADLFAHAALGLLELGMPDPEHDAERETDLIDQAHRMLLAERPPTHPLAVRLLAAAVRVRVHTAVSAREPVEEMSTEALRSARLSGDDHAMAAALLARHDALWRPGTAGDRLPVAADLAAVGRRASSEDVEMQGELLRYAALLELGDPRAHSALAAFRNHADRSALPRHRFVALSRSGVMDLIGGRFDAARTAFDEAYALGERLGEVDRIPLWLEQRWSLAFLADDTVEMTRLIDRYRQLAGGYTVAPELITAAVRGDTERTAELLGEVEALSAEYPRHFHALILVARAHAALTLDADALRKSVRDKLFPLRGHWAVTAAGGACYGPYSFWLGRLAAAAGDHETAAAELGAAAESARRMRSRPWRTAAERQLRLLAHGNVTPSSPNSVSDNEFRFDGSVWTLRFAGRTVRLPNAKGLHDLHTLLGHPGHDIPSLELFATAGAPTRAGRSLGADPVLDDEAKAAYRRRLSTLDAEIDRAAARGADDRAADLDRERAALIEELRRATGLAGRSRRLGGDAERARKTVSARVRDSLRRIDRLHPELAEHLRASISLGLTCRYQPHREITWTL